MVSNSHVEYLRRNLDPSNPNQLPGPDEQPNEDLNRCKLMPHDQMKIPIQTWIRGSIFQAGQCVCRGTSARNPVVTSVLKIQNGTLLQKYNLAKKLMKTQLAAHVSAVDKLVNKTKQPDNPPFPALDQDINELFLFHGTPTGDTNFVNKQHNCPNIFLVPNRKED